MASSFRVVVSVMFSVSFASNAPEQFHLAAASRTSFRVSFKTEFAMNAVCYHGSDSSGLNKVQIVEFICK